MIVKLGKTPIDIYVVTGLVGLLDVQNVSSTTVYISAGSDISTPLGEYNIMEHADWRLFEDTKLMAYSEIEDTVVIVNQNDASVV